MLACWVSEATVQAVLVFQERQILLVHLRTDVVARAVLVVAQAATGLRFLQVSLPLAVTMVADQ